MKRICMNSDCALWLEETEFESETEACPNCGETDTAPAWVKEYRLPGELELRHRIRTLMARRDEVDQALEEATE